ncbi:MAG: bifunctional helix-turn-helix transcriptional regulator/GNAT family N-acetyltransferase [Rhodobacterales bacterium]|nr:bifunctional helix-turn-helix transcriptional regulator/GNAT family N-acetyltransferase [Rhodobacterales bacterium]
MQLVKSEGTDVADLRQRLDLDTGLLSRLLRSLEDEGLIEVVPDPRDGRRRIARLTSAGLAEWQVYDALGHARAQAVLDKAGARQAALIAAMDLIATVMLRNEVQIRDADPDKPASLACLRSYYDFLLSLSGIPASMLPLPLPDAEKYRPPTGVFLVAWSDDLPVGCVSLRALEPGIAEVKRLWVDPVARGQGLARRMMRAVESRARDLGFSAAKLDSNTILSEAVALYRSDGWTECAPYTDPPANIWMTKRL